MSWVKGRPTVPRVQLMAILYAVQSLDVWRHLQIFTDSLTSLRLIRRWVFCPRELKEDDRVDLFDGIGEAMATREGNTKPHKVKAHADNEGNETVEQPGPRKRQDASRTAEGCGTRESRNQNYRRGRLCTKLVHKVRMGRRLWWTTPRGSYGG